MTTGIRAEQRHLFTAIASLGQDTRIRLLLSLLLIVAFSGAAALGKKLHPSMGIPGSSAVYWLAPLVFGKAVVRRDGTGVAMGVLVPVWGLGMGLNNSLLYNVGLYGVTGLGLDLAAKLPVFSPRHLFGGVLIGAVGHMVKFAYILSYTYVAGISRHFLLVGTAKAAALHLAFGAAAGLAGWLAWLAWSRGGARGKGP
jgi:hypothetical protein